MGEAWHSLQPIDILQKLNSQRSGLTDADAHERLAQYGYNELESKKKILPIIVFLRQFLSPLIYVLVAAVIVSAVVGHFMDAGVIAAVLLLNAAIGYIQETRAEKAMEALKQLAAPKAQVRRDRTIKTIPAREIMPGDIILLEPGNKVPTDARLIEQSNLKTNDSALTGESMPVEKSTRVLEEDISLADRKNMVYMGTIVTYGRATAVAVDTGMSTEIGKIASGLREVREEKTPLQKSIGKLSKYIVVLFLGILALLVIIGLLQGLDWLEVFLLAVAAAVSAIPEGLPAVVTVVLAMGMRIMAHRNVIIRRLVAVETLGSATVICTDKTGTLTLNEMTVRRLLVDGQTYEVSGSGYEITGKIHRNGQDVSQQDVEQLRLHLRIGVLTNDAMLSMEDDECCHIIGDPTEGALIVVAAKVGIEKEKLEKNFPRIGEIPFQSEKQYMATLHPRDNGRVAYIKGAPEKILSLSSHIIKDGTVSPIQKSDVEQVMAANVSMAKDALRVIATAYVDLDNDLDEFRVEDIKGKLIFVGLSGMADPPRQEAKNAVNVCKQAGIKVVMITGDNKVTAESIARQIGLPPGEAITGAELQHMDDEELSARIGGISVFARIEPLHKLRIVNMLKSHGHVVAMTGDGVNDAPAIKAADIGIAMGITGTDVAKESSDMILTDDNFASVVAAVDEGRAVFNRLRSVVFFLLSTNLGELLALILSVAFIGKAPLLAVQIIWVNLVTDTAGAIPLGLEPKYGDELKMPPRHPKVGLAFPGLFLRVGFLALIMSLGIFLIFRWAEPRMGIDAARTLAFCSMVSFEWFRAFNARSDEHTAFKLGIFRNRWLVLTIMIAILLQLAVVYLPFFQMAFSTVPLGIREWGIAILAGGSLFVIEETRKILFPRLFSLGKFRPLRNTNEAELEKGL